MGKHLKILLVEDSDDDALLLIGEINRGGYEVRYERVETREAMAAALESQAWDLVISDYAMPAFSAFDALKLLQQKAADLPFIIMSGSIGEGRAVEILKAGASDFITKGVSPRLIPAITRELREAEERRARKRAETALREAETRFQSFFESAADAIISINHDGIILTSNNAAEKMFGYENKEIVGKPVGALITEKYADLRTNLIGEHGLIGKTLEAEGLKKEGTEFPIELSLTAWRNGEEKFYGAIIRDVSERQNLEARLRQSQKMEAIGQLAGGIAHDFNNLLTIINGRSQLMMSCFKPGEKARNDLELIYKTGERAASLTRQLLGFSRKQVLQPVVLDLNIVAGEMDTMLRRLIHEDIQLATILDPALKRVKADPGQIEQIIMNLAVNARDAMPDGGLLTIETANVELSEEYSHAHADVKAGHYVMLAVSDTGQGIDAAIKARVFEPFFTTKPKGKGTGLGLAMVFGIVKQSNGYIEVYSEVGKGTTFKIYLPQTQEKSISAATETQLAAAVGKEVILVVEDEEGVRELVRDLLEANGYTVLTARSGKEALCVCSTHSGKISLIVTDVVMPEMGGPELALHMKAAYPGTKILFTSGYTDHAIVRNGVLDAGVAFIQKPFTPGNLARKIREVLDKAG